MLLFKLNLIQVLAVSALGLAAGAALKRGVPLLDRLHVPAPVAGGLLLALAALALRAWHLGVEMDLALRDPLMVAFFTTVGLNASWRLVRQGGRDVLLLLGLATLGAVLQNGLGIAVARLLGLDPRLGILAGAVALAGGPATSLAFGDTFEKMGVTGATEVAMASAMFGITAASVLGGWVGGVLIRKHRLASQMEQEPAAPSGAPPRDTEARSEYPPVLRIVIAICIAMGLGSLISAGIERLGIVLPAYIGAMIAAAALRNLNDRFRWIEISQPALRTASAAALALFIVMALASLRLWELARLAGPLLLILLLETALTVMLSLWLVYRALGGGYQVAVMAGGFCGFMLGITANALASMDVLEKKFGPAPRAFLAAPLVGAFLIDFTNALVITVMANLFR